MPICIRPASLLINQPKNELTLTYGTFHSVPEGVSARLHGAIARYSRVIPWWMVPAALATLQALCAEIEDGSDAADSVFEMICARFRLSPAICTPIVERALGRVHWEIGPDAPKATLWHESDLLDDSYRLIDWLGGLATAPQTPATPARHLRKVVALPPTQLKQYVTRTLRS